tara:strand:+ start:8 stop:337 length:330 start_codon:yes stop_codon:yes gene_type:complete
MKKLIAIVAGEPNSINSEIISKAWKKNNNNNFFLIGNYMLLKKQIHKIGIKISLNKIDTFDQIQQSKKLSVLNVPLKFKSIFKVNILDVREYVLKCLNIAHKLALKKKN